MNPADRYIDDVMRQVFATQEDQERLETDLRAHFAEGEAAGREPRDIILGLGSPEEVAVAFNAEREFRYASFWERLFAFLGDCGILLIVILPVLALGMLGGVVGSEPNQVSLFWIFVCFLFFLALVGVGIFYFPLFESHYGKTPGKHLMRLRVRRENGAPISLGQAFVRRLSFYFDMLWIDALFIPFTDKRQRALDIVAKTVVAREPGRSASAGSYFLCLLLMGAPVCGLLCLALICSPW